MNERLGLLFSDSSVLLLPEETDIDDAQKEAKEHDQGEPHPLTCVVRLKIEIIETIGTTKNKTHVRTERIASVG